MKGNLEGEKIWDVIVIGGGPAGMMAAGRAAEREKKVLLLEKNSSLGKKLLITGGGRCNVTNNKLDMRSLVESYRNTPKALFSVFAQHGVDNSIEFFNSRGMKTKVEAEGRVFPVSDRSESVLNVLIDFIKSGGVQIMTNSSVQSIKLDEATKRFSIRTNKETYITRSCIVAAGGSSRPETGSSGDGFKWLENLGHTIAESNLALVPVAIKDNWVRSLAGVTLRDIRISIYQDGKKQLARIGKILFTHFGVSGPTVLNMSSTIADLLVYGDVLLELDLLPEIDHGLLKKDFQDLLLVESNKKLKNTLRSLIPSSFVKVILELANVNGDTANHSITKDERKRILMFIKAVPMQVKGILGADKAIVSSGGIDINEVNFQTMESKIVPNLFVVGDMLNIDRPSGGYSLQICWSTGFVAGNSC